jgi:chromosome segregation ATPase
MEVREEFRRLVENKGEREAKIVTLEGNLRSLKAKTAELETEATRSEALEEHGAKHKRELVDENKRAIAEAEAEIPKHRAAITIIGQEIKKLENDAFDSLKPKFREIYEKALRELFKKFKEAVAMERQLMKIRDEVESELRSLGVNPHRSGGGLVEPTGSVLPIFLDREWLSGDQSGILEMFVARCKLNGYDLE